MITEDYVSYKTAKLLKEKGFDEATFHDYDEKGICWFEEVLVNHNSQGGVACPTLQMAMKWLRVQYNLHIMVDCIGSKNYMPTIQFTCNSKDIKVESNENKIGGNGFDSFEEACESAIKYCLENLV